MIYCIRWLYLPYRDLCQTFERISDVADQFRLVLSLVHYFQLRKRLKNLALCILLYWSHFQPPYRFPHVNYLKSKILHVVIWRNIWDLQGNKFSFLNVFRYIPNMSFTADDEHFVVHMIGAGVSIMPRCLGGIILTDGLEGLDSSSSFLMPETF